MVILHPADNPRMYHPLFHTDPEKFKPKPDPGMDVIESWGVRPLDEWNEAHAMQAYMHIMTTQTLYGRFGSSNLKHPEEQFVEVLKKKKEAALAASLPSVTPLFKSDFVVDIELWGIKPRVWRRFKVSGGMTLAALQDKVISPLMGWVRHYHAYCYHDGADGAVYGPAESTAIDMMHASRKVVLMMDDTKYRLAHLLSKPGDKAGYTYDLGDNWFHIMTLVEVISPEESDSTCKVLDGAMACPPEDSNGFEGMGNLAYQDFLKEWEAAKGSKRKALEAGAQNASNTGRAWRPDKFSVGDCNQALTAALRSKASAPSGQKVTSMPLFPGAQNLNMMGAPPSRGANFRSTAHPNGFYEQEVISTRRDPKNLAVCAECGSPNDLKYCSGCRQVRFCSQDCQRKAWKPWHKAECQKYQRKHPKGSSNASAAAAAAAK